MDRQLTFGFEVRQAFERADFLVSDCNRDAALWVDRWPDWPAPSRGLVIVGPPECGKTHLGAVWRARSGATEIHASSLDVESVPNTLGDARDALIDGLDVRASDEALFHLYNLIAERGGSILILSRVPPARLDIGLRDLASRLATLPVVSVGVPDEGLLAGVLSKHFSDRQVRVGDDVLGYIVDRMERSFEGARRLADRLDLMALAEGKRVNRSLARRALDAEASDGVSDGRLEP